MVISMRPFSQDQVDLVSKITERFPKVHGGPVYSGWNFKSTLGIKDLSKPDFGDAVTINEGEIPVFWACGVTP